jgi:hypothetical protein
MQAEILGAVNTGSYVNISATAKAAVYAPITQAILIQSKKDIHALVTAKTIKIMDNMHLLLGSVNPTPNPQANGSNVPTAYYNFDTLQIQAIHL